MAKKKKKNKKEKFITYSSGISLVVSHACRNRCGYCGFWKNDYRLFVPYNTIKLSKTAVKKGAKEILIISGERPDKFHPVKNNLDLWGFPSFARYLYTICELAFLEGLLPRLNVGYLTFHELLLLKEVSVALDVSLGATAERFFKNGEIHQFSPGKSLEVTKEFLENAGRLKIPVSINYLIGVGEKISERKKEFLLIRELHEKFGHIQELAINNFFPAEGRLFKKLKQIKASEVLKTLKLAKKILQPDIVISVKPWQNKNLLQLLKNGASDLGLIPLGLKDELTGEIINNFEPLKKKLLKNNFVLKKRLPIFPKYVQLGWYSGKMGQLLDKYRDEIK